MYIITIFWQITALPLTVHLHCPLILQRVSERKDGGRRRVSARTASGRRAGGVEGGRASVSRAEREKIGLPPSLQQAPPPPSPSPTKLLPGGPWSRGRSTNPSQSTRPSPTLLIRRSRLLAQLICVALAARRQSRRQIDAEPRVSSVPLPYPPAPRGPLPPPTAARTARLNARGGSGA